MIRTIIAIFLYSLVLLNNCSEITMQNVLRPLTHWNTLIFNITIALIQTVQRQQLQITFNSVTLKYIDTLHKKTKNKKI
jgi:hypothetical protein